MKKLVFILICITWLSASGQSKPSVVEYFDKEWKPITNAQAAVYYRTIEELDGQFIVKDFFKESDKIQMEAICSQIKPDLKLNGKATWYYENGTLKREASYQNDIPVGLVRTYYENGKPNTEEIHDSKKMRYVQYWNSSGEPLLLGGNGMVRELDTEAGVVRHQLIKDSVLFCTYKVDVNTQDTIFSIVESPPVYQDGLKAFYNDLASIMVYPKYARRYGIEGRVFISFVIRKNGDIENAYVLRGIGGGCDEAAVEAIQKLRKWQPATQNGKAVNANLSLAVIFKLK